MRTHPQLTALLGLGALLTFSPARAQTAPAPASPPPDDEQEKTVVLDPFEVQSTQDNGYVAQNSVSGTRLNTSLRDTPMAISVFTQQFMEDIDATNIAEVAEYAPNVSLDIAVQGSPPTANGNALTTGDTTFHVRGQPTAANGNRFVDLFQSQVEEDTFNIERLEAARGPNTLLFGLGSDAGTFNVVTKTADPNRDFGSATFRFGENDSAREAIDLNASILPGKLALRVNAVDDDEGSWRPHEFNDAKRLAIALRYQISPKWTFDSEYEGGHVNDSVQRPWGGFDSITQWRADGSQLVAKAQSAIPANSGLESISANDWPMYTTNNGQFFDWIKMSQSAETFSTAAASSPMLFDFSIVPKAATLGGPAVGMEEDYANVSEFLRGEVAPNLFVEFAYDHQRTSILGRDIGNNLIRVFYDTNDQLPNGQPNPYVDQPYVNSQLVHRDRWDFADDYLGTVSYSLDLGKIFGHHQFAGLAEARAERIPSVESTDVLLSNPYSTVMPDEGPNTIREQTYVNLNGPVANISLAEPTINAVNVVNQSNGQPVTAGFVPDTNVFANRYFGTTASAVLQSDFWDDRIVTTIGDRNDRLDSRLSTVGLLPGFGPFQNGNYYAVPGNTPIVNQGNTRTLGGVFNVTPWLGLFYNAADDFTLPNNTITLTPDQQAPPPTGKDEDMGLKFELLHGHLFATVTYYQTTSKNDSQNLPAGLSSNSTPYLNDIFQTLNAGGLLAANGLSLLNVQSSGNGTLYDSRSQGWEFELVSNPSDNLRLYSNFSINQTIDTNVGTQFINYVAQFQNLFTKYGSLPLTTGSSASVQTVADAYNQILALEQTNFIEDDGVLELGNSKYSANLRAEYTVTQSVLKGVFFGVGDRYRGRPVIGYTSLVPSLRQPIETASNNVIDANVGYKRKIRLGRKAYDWRVQLSVTNVFDNTHLLINGVYGTSATAPYTPYTERGYSFQPPQAWTLSNTIGF